MLNEKVSSFIQDNRLLAVRFLKYNPMGFRQIRMNLIGKDNERCATGLIAEGFHVDPRRSDETYAAVTRLLEIQPNVLYAGNDAGDTFDQIARHLSDRWNINYDEV